MRLAIALLLVLHGIAHGVGFVEAWGLRSDLPGLDHLLGGRVPLDPAGMRVIAVFWLLAGLAVAAAGVAAALNKPYWLPLALGTGSASLMLCLLTLPEAWVGAALNVGLLALLTLGLRQGWAWAAAR